VTILMLFSPTICLIFIYLKILQTLLFKRLQLLT